MRNVYLYPHLGFGDAIILNALVRKHCSENDSVTLFCKDRYHESIRWMFRDIENLSYHQVSFGSGDYEIEQFIESNNLHDDVIRLGFGNFVDVCRGGVPFYEAFYVMNDIDPEFRFLNFHYERNLEYENYVYDQLNPNDEKYIFVVDDSSHHLGTLKIPEDRLPDGYKIIKYDKTLNENNSKFLMFNYGKILEKAEQIHTIETAFFEFIRSIDVDRSKVNVHSYLRKYITKPIEGYTFLEN